MIAAIIAQEQIEAKIWGWEAAISGSMAALLVFGLYYLWFKHTKGGGAGGTKGLLNTVVYPIAIAALAFGAAPVAIPGLWRMGRDAAIMFFDETDGTSAEASTP